MGLHKSWATRFFKGDVKQLTDEQVRSLETLLGVEFFSIVRADQHSTSAHQIARLYDDNPAFARVMEALRESLADTVFTPRYVPTKEMARIGNEIVRIANTERDKPGKVARQVLELLS